ncbi:MAG: type IV toxin-antitoxin system AbiEi family antitoxin domain-containing protein [Streptosporangiaceae bacterium]
MTTRGLPANCRDLVELQHGVISRRQALDAGIGAATVRSMLHSGRWVPVHRGVYLIHTGAPDREATFWSALLRAGRQAMLSHYTAAEVTGLTRVRE